MGLDPATLLDLAHAVKDAIVTRWPTDPAVATPLPARRFVSNGSMVWDCDQLAIGIDTNYGTTGDPAFESISAQVMGGLGYVVTAASVTALLLRCIPEAEYDAAGEPTYVPTPEEIESSAETILTDAVVLFNVILEASEVGDLGPCQGIAYERGQAEGPEGGLGGWSVKIRALLL